MCKSADSSLAEAKHQLAMGDDEMACLSFMKYFNLVEMIRKGANFGHRQYIASELGSDSKIAERMVQFEQIKRRLNER